MQPSPASPFVAEASLLHRLTSATDRLDWAQVFRNAEPVEIELGSGDGSFLVEYARLHPERSFLGVERLMGRIRKLDREGRRAGLQNLRGVRVECGYFTEYLVPPESVAAFHIYFPDPWPKKRHAKNRLVQPRLADSLQRALTPTGSVFLRTDHPDYFAQMLEVFRGAVGWEEFETPSPLAAVLTDFEREFTARGIQTHRAAFRKVVR
jgi:tRNA (guanine-N7-)-methyltransferase